MAYKQPSDTVPPYDSPEHSFVHPGRYHSSGIPALHQIPEPRPTGNSQSFHEEQYHDPYNSDTHSLNRSSVEPWDSASQRQNSLSSHHTPSSHSSHLHNKPSHGGLSYIDEEGAYYHSDRQRPASAVMSNGDSRNDLEMRGLMGNAADMGRDDEGGPKIKFTEYQDSPHPYPPANYYRDPSQLYSWLLFPTGLDRLAAMLGIKAGQTPLGQAIERKKRGLGGQRWPVAAWSLAVLMTALTAYELVRNNQLTGSPIATKPNFNYMIGPTSSVLINIGAKFSPCIKLVSDLPPTFQLQCLNDTANPPTTACSLESICGHGGFPNGVPDQSWRFVWPIFLHVGVIHLLLNMLAQVTAAAQVEREMGTIPFLIVYMAGGIYGFLLGGNFSRSGIPSVGASGALFATNACVLVDLLMHWKYEERPKLKAFLLFVEFLIGFAIGYIPNAVDGLAHLGGWAMGILMGIILYPSISETNRRRYILWGLRVVALCLVVLAFVLTIKNFYTDDPNAACEWCRYLSCIPLKSNGYCKGTGITVTQTTTRRSWDL